MIILKIYPLHFQSSGIHRQTRNKKLSDISISSISLSLQHHHLPPKRRRQTRKHTKQNTQNKTNNTKQTIQSKAYKKTNNTKQSIQENKQYKAKHTRKQTIQSKAYKKTNNTKQSIQENKQYKAKHTRKQTIQSKAYKKTNNTKQSIQENKQYKAKHTRKQTIQSKAYKKTNKPAVSRTSRPCGYLPWFDLTRSFHADGRTFPNEHSRRTHDFLWKWKALLVNYGVRSSAIIAPGCFPARATQRPFVGVLPGWKEIRFYIYFFIFLLFFFLCARSAGENDCSRIKCHAFLTYLQLHRERPRRSRRQDFVFVCLLFSVVFEGK